MWASFMELLMSGPIWRLLRSGLPAFTPTASVNIPHPKRHAGECPNQISPYVRHTSEHLSWITPYVDCLSYLRPPNRWTIWETGHRAPVPSSSQRSLTPDHRRVLRGLLLLIGLRFCSITDAPLYWKCLRCIVFPCNRWEADWDSLHPNHPLWAVWDILIRDMCDF